MKRLLLAVLSAVPFLLAFPGCDFTGHPCPPGVCEPFDPGAAPRTSAIFCDIEEHSRCATREEAGDESMVGTGIDRDQAFPSGFWIGRSNTVGLTRNPGACPSTGKIAKVYKHAFPNGGEVCVNPATISWTYKADTACKAWCYSLNLVQADGTPYDCANVAWRSVGVAEELAFPNVCSESGTLLPDRDPRKPRPVTWTERVGTTDVPDGPDLQKAGDDPDPQLGMWGDAGAVSNRQLTSGDGVVLVTASEGITFRVFGLGYDDTGRTDNITDVEYGLLMTNEVHPMDPDPQNPTMRRLLAFEPSGPVNGTPVGPYKTGDDLAVAVFNGEVTYWRNGTRIYRSTVPPTHSPAHPMRAEAALFSQTATLKNTRASF